MAGKSKFQISRSLDEKLKKFIVSNEECDPEFQSLASAFILGFNYSNVTNYVGLTTNFKLHNGTTPVVGLAYFKELPDEQQIKADLQPAIDYFRSPSEGLGSYAEVDKNEHLYLIYYKDSSGQANKKLYDSNNSVFLQEQPKLSVLDDAKIYGHSAVAELYCCFKLQILKEGAILQDKDKLLSVLDEAKEALTNSAGGLKIHLLGSNFSSSNPQDNKSTLESLYSHLDIPDEVHQMGDYLPQVTKEEQKKLADKWRNKMKDQREPLEFRLEHENLFCDIDDKLPDNIIKIHLTEYLYLHVNDSVAKSTRYILLMLRQKLELVKKILIQRHSSKVQPTLHNCSLQSCTFKPVQLNHLVSAVYLIPENDCATPEDYQNLAECRRDLHMAHLISLQQPAVRFAQRVMSVRLKNLAELAGYLCNVHTGLEDKSGIKGGTRSILGGTYRYYHYQQDRVQDSGWGCAYRSLQTIISWFKHQAYIYSPDVAIRSPAGNKDGDSKLRRKLHLEARVPTHEEIQWALMEVGDKPVRFIGSQKWIGSQEICYVLNHLYNLECKFISVRSASELVYKARDLGEHFARHSTPVMIGGGQLAHTILGLDFNEKNGDISYLILDPHWTGGADLQTIIKKGWCGWKKNSFWDKSAFYNLCLPQRPVEF